MAKYIHIALHLPSQIAKLLLFAKAVYAAMNGNPNYPNATGLLAILKDRILSMEKAMTTNAGDRLAARGALGEALEHLGDHVQGVAETAVGSVDIAAIRAMILNAGLDLRKVGAHQKAVFAAKYGPVPGSVDLTAPRSRARDPHEWGVSTDQITWVSLPPTRQASTRVTDLPVGVPHHFRHRLLTKDGYTEWSDPTVMIVVK